jgi:hypothetical protein
MSILDKFPNRDAFVPSTLNQYFALQLARKLGDTDNVSAYVSLAEIFSQDHLLSVYRQVVASDTTDTANRFRSHFQ